MDIIPQPRTCTRCGKSESDVAFPKQQRRKLCNACQESDRRARYAESADIREHKRQYRITHHENRRIYHMHYYQRNKLDIKQKSREGKLAIRAWLAEYKSTCCCVKCGESHPACLSFHHRDPAEKRFTISYAADYGLSPDVILEEIAKCDVLCRNCHAKAHWKR